LALLLCGIGFSNVTKAGPEHHHNHHVKDISSWHLIPGLRIKAHSDAKSGLEKGIHTIRVELNGNDHNSWLYQGKKIENEIMVTID